MSLCHLLMTLFVFYLFQETSDQHEDIGEET